MARKWKGTLAVEGVQTGDGRIMAEGALSWASLPLPLAWLQQSQHGDGMGNPGGIDLGTISDIARDESGKLAGSGLIDDLTDTGADFVRRLEDGTAPLGNRWGVSVDVDDVVVAMVDTRPESDEDQTEDDDDLVLLGSGAHGRRVATLTGALARSAWKATVTPTSWWRSLTAAAGDPIPDDATIEEDPYGDRFVMMLVSGRVRGATACQIAAFDEAWIELDGTADATDDAEDQPADEEPAAVTAAGGFPVHPPVGWFGDSDAPVDDDDPRLVPQYDLETGAFIGLAVPLTITDDGRVFGQLAPKNRCHIALSTCVTAPDSPSAYSHFMLGTTRCADGTDVATGTLIMGCDHAPHSMTMGQARDHYANTGMEWADVTVTANRYGPWVSGALRPNVTDELLRTLRGGGISGDWRGYGNDLELVAIQGVPVPGFTVQRVRPLAASASVEVRPWQPAVTVSEGRITITTPPVQQAAVTASACGCGMTVLTASADDRLMLALEEVLAEVRTIKLHVAPMRATAVDALAARIRGRADHR